MRRIQQFLVRSSNRFWDCRILGLLVTLSAEVEKIPGSKLCWQCKRSTYLFLAAAGFDFLTGIAFAAIVASKVESRLPGGCRHVVESLNMEREEPTQ